LTDKTQLILRLKISNFFYFLFFWMLSTEYWWLFLCRCLLVECCTNLIPSQLVRRFWNWFQQP